MSGQINFITESYPNPPAMDTAVSHVLLKHVADGRLGETLRVHSAGRVVAFGRRDVVAPGYQQAVRSVLDEGFGAVERLAGGRAAVFHEGTLAISQATRHADPRSGIHERFQTFSQSIADALGRIGIDARIGEMPGEYCPGRYSVNVGGRLKVMGVGQRLKKTGAHMGAVLVVSGREMVNRPLIPAYSALGIDWDPSVTGDIERLKGPMQMPDLIDLVASELADKKQLVPIKLTPAILDEARALLPLHQVESRPDAHDSD